MGLLDSDGDGVADSGDNCPTIPNGDQDALACGPDADFDEDGIGHGEDNCPIVANEGQEDENMDGIGDICADDRDGDGAIDGTPDGMPMAPPDNCPGVANPEQEDSNFDGTGDRCTLPVPE